MPVNLRAAIILDKKMSESQWCELIDVLSFDNFRHLVIALGFQRKPTPSVSHLDAFLADPSYGYEYFKFQVTSNFSCCYYCFLFIHILRKSDLLICELCLNLPSIVKVQDFALFDILELCCDRSCYSHAIFCVTEFPAS